MAQSASDGLVVFRAPSAISDETWTAVQRYLREIAGRPNEDNIKCGLSFHDVSDQEPSAEEAANIAEKNLDPGMAAAARTHRDMASPFSWKGEVILYVDARSAASMVEPDAPGGTKHPFVFAVEDPYDTLPHATEEDADNEDKFRGWLKVHTNNIVTDLFSAVGDGSMALFELGVGTADNDIWRYFGAGGVLKGQG